MEKLTSLSPYGTSCASPFANCRELKIGSKIVAEWPWAFEVDTQKWEDTHLLYVCNWFASFTRHRTPQERKLKSLARSCSLRFWKEHYVSDVLKYIPATMLFTCGLRKIVTSVNTLPVFGHVILQKPVVCLYGQWEHNPCILYSRPGIRAEKNETVLGGAPLTLRDLSLRTETFFVNVLSVFY